MASFCRAALVLLLFVSETFCSVIKNQENAIEEPIHVHDLDDLEDDPSQRLAYLHLPSENGIKIDQLSRLLLVVTKDLISVQPRTKGVRQDVGLAEKLASLLSLNPDDVRALLSYHSIKLPQIQNRTCGIESLFYRTIDGSCNNLKNPCWGKTDEPYQRWLPPSYANGIDEPRKMRSGFPLPNPRQINQWVSSQFEPSDETSFPHFTNLVVVWGQMMAHDILLTPTFTVKVWDGKEFKNEKPHCCKSLFSHPECIPILTHGDEYYEEGFCMDIQRSSAYMFSPYSCSPLKLGRTREQMNQLTSFIDASIVYGVTEDKMRKLRENGGYGAKLVMDSSTGWSYLPRKNASSCSSSINSCSKECFFAGEVRANENPVLAALHTLWAREHNRLVDLFRVKRWSDEMLFHVVRKIVGAMLQHTTYKEYLPIILGPTLMNVMKLTVPSEHYKYDESVNPTLYNSFVTAAFRYGHSMVTTRYERAGRVPEQSRFLSADFFSMDDYCTSQSDAVSSLLEGQLRQKAQKVDSVFTKQLTNHLFAKTVNGKGFDLFSLNVQRGRDHGIPPYNEWRKVCGLPAARDYADLKGIIPDYVIDRLEQVYGPGNVDEIDLFVGGISEFPVNDGILGPTFTCIVANQVRNLKVGDRFWYENLDNPGAFSRGQIASIQRTTISSIICRNSDIKEMPQLAFLLESPTNPKMSCRSIVEQTDIDLGLW